MKELEIEARKYANITHNRVLDEEERYYKDYQKYDGFIAGATSSYIEQEKIKFAIEQLNDLDKKECGECTKHLQITNKIKKLEQKLLENENI